MITVYHGGTEIIDRPRVDVGRPNLDFGPGFYVTDMYAQAQGRAMVASKHRNARPIVTAYSFDKDAAVNACRFKRFSGYDQEWLDFISGCRKGEALYETFELIEGPIADDKVIESVRLYMTGFISSEECLRRLIYKKPNHQLCILRQELLDRYLKFESYTIIEGDGNATDA